MSSVLSRRRIMKSARTMVTGGYLRFFLLALPFLLAAAAPRSCQMDVQCGDVLAFDDGEKRQIKLQNCEV
jgi:hypothetical protein